MKNGTSPEWLQRYLQAIGLRPISALVDITNYITFDLGRPLHVFDLDKLSGDLTMRFARKDESVVTLDGHQYLLDEETIVISDESARVDKVQGIGGIMGGMASSCTEDTQNVFIEVALFDPVSVAATGRRLGIKSDARYRFERGVDPQSALWGAEVAARLIKETCGGEASYLSIAGEMPNITRQIELRRDRAMTLGGLEISSKRTQEILNSLGFLTESRKDVINAIPPSWRPDIESEACLVEEVLRVNGFEAIPTIPLERKTLLPSPAISPSQRREFLFSKVLAGRGMMEAVTWSFVSEEEARLFGSVRQSLYLSNPISAAHTVMRPSVLPNLLNAAVRNINRGHPNLALFEVGATWCDDSKEGQKLVAAGIRTGSTGPLHWSKISRSVDVFDVKADTEAVLELSSVPIENFQTTAEAPDWYHPGRSGIFQLGKKTLAQFGELHPQILQVFDLSAPVVAFEVIIDNFPPLKSQSTTSKPPLQTSPYQSVTRDFAFVIDKDMPAIKLVRAAKAADPTMITDVTVFDVYQDEKIGENEKSVAISVTLQPIEGTFTDAQIDSVAEKIVKSISRQTNGVLRE